MRAVAEFLGAIAVLGAFIAAEAGLLHTRTWTYQWLNLLGSSALAVVALFLRQWGFLALEGVWAVVSAIALIRKIAKGKTPVGVTNE